MKKIDQLEKTKNLLSQALSTALNSMPNNSSVNEARGHIKQAINKIDKARKTQMKKQTVSSTLHENWWGHVQAGVSASPVSQEASMRTLEQLNQMINEEKDKISEIENKIDKDNLNKDNSNQILND